jgi:flagellar protein FlbT
MSSLHISLRSGEKIYVNGAVLRFDRKVTLELMNDATFLLESHVIQATNATTPLRQLYFVVQTMLVAPAEAGEARALFAEMLPRLCRSFANEQVLAGLAAVRAHVEAGRAFDALKVIRTLFPVERAILAKASPQSCAA